MKKTTIEITKSIFVYFLICFSLLLLTNLLKTPKSQNTFIKFDLSIPGNKLFNAQANNPALENNFKTGKFTWLDSKKVKRYINFSLNPKNLEEEEKNFGLPRGLTHPMLVERRGFKSIRRSNYTVNNKIYTKHHFIIDYKKVFDNSKDFFSSLTIDLTKSFSDSRTSKDFLLDHLLFVQQIPYKIPPKFYNKKFINQFYTPLLTLKQQYGDCDTKCVLLAEFLANQNPKESILMFLLGGINIKHSILAVKRKPLLGTMKLYVKGKGYYIPLESSAPGWAPGFVNRRLMENIRSGHSRHLVLN